MNVLVRILQGGNLFLAFLAPTLELAMRIKHLWELDPDFKVNLTQLTGEAIAADDATLAAIAAWKKKNGL
jgi:hypothetical protein